MIRDCTVIAVEGTHASGKTTLVHALTGHMRERGIHVSCTDEPARRSPFMEEIVIHRRGTFDLVAELDLLGDALTTQLRAARHQTVLVTDKTLANIVAYARLFLPADTATVTAMTRLCAATAHLYDAVFYCTDRFDPRQAGDDFRDKVADRQLDVDRSLRATFTEIGVPLIGVPEGLTTAKRVEWISSHLADRGLITALR